VLGLGTGVNTRPLPQVMLEIISLLNFDNGRTHTHQRAPGLEEHGPSSIGMQGGYSHVHDCGNRFPEITIGVSGRQRELSEMLLTFPYRHKQTFRARGS
jgi:hypothetical protein